MKSSIFPFLRLLALGLLVLGQTAVADVFINEFMASNGSTLEDEDGSFEDWVELYNSGSEVVDLSGWGLSDSEKNPFKWQFPEGAQIAAGGYLVVWASGKDKGAGEGLPGEECEEPLPEGCFGNPIVGELHTNFKISVEGEPLILTRADGAMENYVAAVYVPRDVVRARLPDGGSEWYYLMTATAGAPNAGTPVELPPSLEFTESRGFKSEPFQTAILTDDPAAVIRYTLDGSVPDASSPLYTEPLTISSTTTLRASAVQPGMIELPPVTITYLFLEDILQQSSAAPAGWPKNGEVNGHAMRYGMRQAIVNDDGERLREGMMGIPSVSLVTDLDHLFAPQDGIYSNSNRTYGREVPVSVEVIDPKRGAEWEFHIDGGLRLRGGYSRRTNNPKHSFRLLFRSSYGDKELNFPLFEDEGASKFTKVDLMTSQNYSWARENSIKNTFIREVFSRDTQRDMGMPYTRSRYYHLYLNGQYWGLYMTQERGEADYAATYLGGESEDWDAIKTGHPGYVTGVIDGSMEAYHSLHDIAVNQGFTGSNADNYWRVRGMNPDGSRNPNYPVYVDEDNLINYMLISQYTGDPDSPISIGGDFANNLNMVFNRKNPDGFKWLRHDAEHSLAGDSSYGVSWNPTNRGRNLTLVKDFNPATLSWNLAMHPEYRMRFADLVYKHCFGDGALTPENAKARVQQRMAEIDLAIIGESARWGQGHTRDGSWIPACDVVLSYLDQRREYLMEHYRGKGWFPNTLAPEIAVIGDQVRISADVSFYYMTDGSDPRLVGGGVHPEAVLVDLDPAMVEVPLRLIFGIKARALNGGEWSPLAEFSSEAMLEERDIHCWDFEDFVNWKQPAITWGGGELSISPGGGTDYMRYDAAQGFKDAHLRVNSPLGAVLHFALPTTGHGAIRLSYETRRSGSGAGQQLLEYTLDGVSWMVLDEYAVENASPQLREYNLGHLLEVNDNLDFAVRITFAQAEGGSMGNNRFDNVTLSGVLLPGVGTDPTLYAQWQVAQFPDAEDRVNPAISGPLADPAGSGISNLLRYAYGLDLDEAGVGVNPILTNGGREYRFRYSPEKTDLVWRVRLSTDLEDWSEVLFDSELETITVDEDGWASVTVPDDPNGERSQVFVRLEVFLE